MWCQLRIPLPPSICSKISRYQIVVYLYMQKQYMTDQSLSQSSRRKLNLSEPATTYEDDHQPALYCALQQRLSYRTLSISNLCQISWFLRHRFRLHWTPDSSSRTSYTSQQAKVYHGVLILSGLCGDMVVFVWNYHVFSLPDHVRFWNRNQNLWSRPRIYKARSLISKDF